jgi:hypothetical protein
MLDEPKQRIGQMVVHKIVGLSSVLDKHEL